MANCNYKVNLIDIQNKYKFKIFSLGSYNDSDLRKMIESVFYALPRTTGSGTSVTLTDTAFSYLKNKLYVTDTTQDTTTGINKLNTTLATTTLNGITCTKNDNGTYTLNGTASAGTSFTLTTPNPTLSAGTYKLVGIKGGSYSTFSLRAYNSGQSLLYVDTGSGVTFTTNESLSFQIFIDIANGTTLNNVIIKPMITTDTSLTYNDFEKYTGGIPSPNPDYPQVIHTITGDNKINVCGKNLAYRELEGKYRAVSNNGGIQTNVDFNSYIASVNANTNYVAKSFEGEKNFSNLCFFDKDMNYLSGMGFTGNNPYRTFTTPNNCRYITIACYKTISDFMVVSGTDIPSIFELYQSQTNSIYLGSENNFDGKFRQGNENGTGATSIFSRNDLVLRPGTYTFTCDMDMSIYKYAIGTRTSAFPGNATWLGGGFQTNQTFQFTLTEELHIGILIVKLDGTNITPSDVSSYNFKIKEDNTTPIEICKIGNYEDKIFKAIKGNEIYDSLASEEKATLDYGKWYLRKNVGIVNLENETFTGYDLPTGYNFLSSTSISNIKYASVNTELVNCFAEKYIKHTGSGMSGNEAQNHIAIDTNAIRLQTKEAHPTGLFYYPLATPTNELFNDTIQEQLEDIYNNMLSYEGQTNVSQVNDDLPFNINSTALKDLNNL